MRQIVLLFVTFLSFSATASPPIAPTDLVRSGDSYFSLTPSVTRMDIDSEITYLSSGTVLRVSGKGESQSTDLNYSYGLSNVSTVSLQIEHVANSQTEFDASASGYQAKFRGAEKGLGDAKLLYVTLLTDSNNHRVVLGASASFPVGDDDPGQPEIIENGTKTQDLKQGGASTGMTDYAAGAAWSYKTSDITPYSLLKYTISGSKTENGEKKAPGDEILLNLGAVKYINDKSDLNLAFMYNYSFTGKSGDTKSLPYSGLGFSATYYLHASKDISIAGTAGYGFFDNIKEEDNVAGTKEVWSSSGTTLGLSIIFAM
ncbi:MAG: hypothetical protein OEW58_11940 [Gammaproteobacteria bacterium]|nr:hypothetical protein [Gammaproteobacteria bacterium]